MGHNNKRLSELFKIYLSQSITDEEKIEFFDYVQDPVYTLDIQELISDAYENQDGLVKIDEQIKAEVLNSILGESQFATNSKQMRLWPRVAAAIAIVVAVGIGIITYNNETAEQSENTVNDIAPGRNTATLTLANGKKIKLSEVVNGELANEAGVSIVKAADGQVNYNITESNDDATHKINTLSTAKGETYILTLPDKTKVWLNAASSLTYAASLNEGGERRVQLTGEAYFEVTKDKAHPFVVKTASQEVRVLGTHFNINSYEDEPIVTTTLLEGSVEVSNTTLKKKLRPGEQAKVLGTSIKVNEVDPESVVDWTNGDFVIIGEDFRTFMRKVARWYDVEILYDPSVPKDIEPGGWISRKENLSAVLKLIERGGQVHFKVKGRRITVTK